jgi:hypothetical protein
MKSFGNPWGNHPPEEGWSPVGFVDDAMVEMGYRKCIDGANGNTQIILALELERKGGKCPICDTEYRRIDVDNQYGKFSYYQPFCMCFKRCQVCERLLVAERLLEINYCTSCHPNGVQGAKKQTTHKKRGYKTDPSE